MSCVASAEAPSSGLRYGNESYGYRPDCKKGDPSDASSSARAARRERAKETTEGRTTAAASLPNRRSSFFQPTTLWTLRFESLLRTTSIGTPGLTSEILVNSAP